MKMKRFGIMSAAIISGLLAARANAQQVLLSNNFNQPNGNFDNGPLSEYGGTLAGSVVMESQKVEQLVSNNQLSMQGTPGYTTGEVRFDNYGSTASSPPGLFDFSQAATGLSLVAAGGMKISFNWTPADTSNDDWIAIDNSIGTYNDNYAVVDSKTDSGLLLRDDGTTTIFNLGGGGTGTTPGSTLLAANNSVVLDYYYNSFATGSPVTMDAYVNGTLAATQSFSWTNGSDYLELDSDQNGELISNFAISTVPEPTSLGMIAVASLGLLARRRRIA